MQKLSLEKVAACTCFSWALDPGVSEALSPASLGTEAARPYVVQ